MPMKQPTAFSAWKNAPQSVWRSRALTLVRLLLSVTVTVRCGSLLGCSLRKILGLLLPVALGELLLGLIPPVKILLLLDDILSLHRRVTYAAELRADDLPLASRDRTEPLRNFRAWD